MLEKGGLWVTYRAQAITIPDLYHIGTHARDAHMSVITGAVVVIDTVAIHSGVH